MILIKFELKSNSIGLASTKNANWQIAQAMKQKCIFCCFKFLSMIPDACNADFKLRARVRAELLKCQFNQIQMPLFSYRCSCYSSYSVYYLISHWQCMEKHYFHYFFIKATMERISMCSQDLGCG